MNKLATIKQNATSDQFQAPAVHEALNKLTTRQRAFVLGVMVAGLSMSAAAVQAGYSTGSHATILMNNPNVVQAITVMQQEYSRRMELTIEDVQQGMLDAIDVARATDNANAMVAGWREIGKMIGAYVEKKEIKISFEDPESIVNADTADLLKLVSSDIIEGELSEVEDDC
jgi:phage terminase small subunit